MAYDTIFQRDDEPENILDFVQLIKWATSRVETFLWDMSFPFQAKQHLSTRAKGIKNQLQVNLTVKANRRGV